MPSKKNDSINIKKYRNKQEINIGIFVFAIIFVYLIVTIVTYVTSKHVSVYEVREGSILNDTTYTGLVLRDEQTIASQGEGYITYFATENSKVRSASNIYTLSADPLITDEAAGGEAVALTSTEQDALNQKIQNFNDSFTDQDYSKVHTLKTEVEDILQKATNQSKTSQLNMLLASDSAAGLTVSQTPADGIFSLNVDGYEDITKDTVTDADLERTDYTEQTLQDSRKVKNGDAAYKLIRGDYWTIVLQLDKDMAERLSDTTIIKTRIDNSSESIWADFSIVERDGAYLGMLDYDNSMIQYISKRFLNVELILEDESGLKIPKSSVTEKEFYVIPSDYITQGGDSSSSGVLCQVDGNATTEFVQTDIYYEAKDSNTEEKNVYLNPNVFNSGDVIVMPESGETLAISSASKETRKGVYNINKGYTIFQQVNILCESDEYYIINESEAYSLSNYDHIVLDYSSVKEGEVVFQ